MSSILPALAVKLLLLALPAAEQLNASLDPARLDGSERVDVVTVSGRFSYAEYGHRPAAVPETLRFPVHSLTPVAVPFGNCDVKGGRMARRDGGHCGYLLPLGRGPESLNLLGYDELSVKGRFSGSWTLAFADDVLAARQDNVPMGKIVSSAPQAFRLADLLDSADLSRSRQLVLLLDSQTGSAQVEQVTLRHAEKPAVKPGRGIWIWRRDEVLGREERVLGRLAQEGVRRAYLQVGDDPEVFAPFLSAARRLGIEVYALDGSPSYVAKPQELLERIRRVNEYNGKHPEAPYAGFQTDIEPYLNGDFASRKGYYAEGYAALIDRIKGRYGLSLSVVVPFWFDKVHTGRKSLLQRVTETADEVVVMSYRTDPATLLAISRSALSLGEMLHKPVWLGVELGKVPDEEHHELERCAGNAPGAVRLGSSWWCQTAQYTVPGSRISFKSRLERLPSFLETAIPYASFGGWVLHSYEELP